MSYITVGPILTYVWIRDCPKKSVTHTVSKVSVLSVFPSNPVQALHTILRSVPCALFLGGWPKTTLKIWNYGAFSSILLFLHIGPQNLSPALRYSYLRPITWSLFCRLIRALTASAMERPGSLTLKACKRQKVPGVYLYAWDFFIRTAKGEHVPFPNSYVSFNKTYCRQTAILKPSKN